VTLAKGKKKYMLMVDDIATIHKAYIKKRPIVPHYDYSTSDETHEENAL
jgi:hypothetical protein